MGDPAFRHSFADGLLAQSNPEPRPEPQPESEPAEPDPEAAHPKSRAEQNSLDADSTTLNGPARRTGNPHRAHRREPGPVGGLIKRLSVLSTDVRCTRRHAALAENPASTPPHRSRSECVAAKSVCVWLQATYNPILDSRGKPFKIVKYCTDITEQKFKSADWEGQLRAINRSQAVIEFDLTGIILTANENFERVMGYGLDEMRGQHHRMFVDPTTATSATYQAFWTKLGRGAYDDGQYRCLAKGGREVWVQASYNPIFDGDGRALKVVKYASDITEQKRTSLRLDQLVTQIRTATGEVSASAHEISAANASLSQRVERQAASLEETASSMEQMTATVRQNADNAAEANQLATAARGQADEGSIVVTQAVGAMDAIHAAGGQIAEITSVIDEIAFQTNLLALNAAVEAARAGDQGRGFAVVASEVRNLASRSATAAKQIKNLITDTVSKVEDGSKLVTQSGHSLEQIVAAVKKVSDIVAEIAAASAEQSSGIDQIGRAVSQMDEMTQQNAAMVEQAAAASKAIAEQTRALEAAVGVREAPSATPVAQRPALTRRVA
jgi:methyl-accepting chemotaxis protein